MTRERVRVLVVEDSATARERLCETIGSDPGMELAGQAADGMQAVAMCRRLRPDVITMDMMLPVMNGLAATEQIMAQVPTPILIVSSSTNRGELFRTYEALAAGAVDVLEKPRGDEPDGAWERSFLERLRMVARIHVITHPRATLRSIDRPRTEPCAASRASCGESRTCQVVAMGASTGGPGAIVEVLKSLPAGFSLPILLVMHIGEPFGSAFADWLDGQSACRASLARENQSVASARHQVILAPPGRHMIVRQGRVRLTNDPERHFCRPSVDVLFESIAREYGPAGAACLLTGMGRDGAQGMLEIRRAGGFTVAQDEQTSVVFGMPREAVVLGAAEQVLPLGRIGRALAGLIDVAGEARA